MIGNLRLRYLKFIAKIWRGEGQYTNESVVGERVITNANIRINRETKDLELLVSGDMQIGDGERRKEQYSISFPLWNYSISLEEKGISEEVYDQVMEEEREPLFAKYIRAYVILSSRSTEQIRQRAYQDQNVEGIKCHSILQELRDYQSEVYIKLMRLEAQREELKRNQGEDIQLKIA